MEPIGIDIVDDAIAPDENTDLSDRKESIWRLAKRLKKDYQKALILKYIEDLSVGEIARIMNETQTDVEILLFRSRN